MDRCRVEEPPAFEIGRGSAVWCWLHEAANGPRRPAELAAEGAGQGGA